MTTSNSDIRIPCAQTIADVEELKSFLRRSQRSLSNSGHTDHVPFLKREMESSVHSAQFQYSVPTDLIAGQCPIIVVRLRKVLYCNNHCSEVQLYYPTVLPGMELQVPLNSGDTSILAIHLYLKYVL